MAVNYSSQDISFKLFEEEKVSEWIHVVINKHQLRVGEINFVFCSDDYILQINRQYLNHHYFTDVITFDYSRPHLVSGDIVISVDTVRSNAEYYRVSFEQELRRVLVHGVLHLLKYNDTTDDEQCLMTQAENEMLALYATKFQ